MAAVADRLGSYSAMALYRYVSSKDGLVDLMLDDVVAEVELRACPAEIGEPTFRRSRRALSPEQCSGCRVDPRRADAGASPR
jgi:AcrR family transcriptional regulator